MPGRILFVDDDEAMCELIEADLSPRGYDVTTRITGEEALALIEKREFDVVVTDLRLGGVSGIDLCRRLASHRNDLPVIVITAFGNVQAAMDSIRAGAYDFVSKPIDVDDLALRIERAIQHRSLSREVQRLRRVVADREGNAEMVGSSPAMRRVYDLIERVADTEATVLVTGESGTGKELVARAIHARSSRSEGPFVALNCAALPDTLLESELFGHTKGAFTGARGARSGLLVQASGGTLLLDEIGEMPPSMQAKLLRALQERTIRPLGQDREVEFDTRILASTNRNLEEEVDEGRFREDLFYRINVVNIHLPPLRSRGDDLLLLAQRFLERFAARDGSPVHGLSKEAAERLVAYDWPGNVRELQNCIERAVVMARGHEIGLTDLPRKVYELTPTPAAPAPREPVELLPMHEVERRYVLRVLSTVGGNKAEAARVLGFDRKTLYRKLERWGAA